MKILYITGDGPLFEGIRPWWDGQSRMVYGIAKPWRELQLELGNFQPDMIVIGAIDYTVLPPGIEHVEVPLVFLMGDWNLALSRTLPILGMADAIVADQPGLDVLKTFGFSGLHWYRYCGFRGNPVEKGEVKLDVSFVGNFNHDIHTRRARFLARLADLSDRHRIGIFTGVFEQDYRRVLAASRIVFNMTVRGELNMRCFEAGIGRAALLVERDNVEVHPCMPEGTSSMMYDENDFEAVVESLIADPARVERLATAATQIYTDMSSTHVSSLKDVLKSVKKTDRAGWFAHSPEERQLALANQAQLCMGSAAVQYAWDQLRTVTGVEAVHGLAAMALQNPGMAAEPLKGLAKALATHAQTGPVGLYTAGCLLHKLGEVELAVQALRRSSDLLVAQAPLEEKFLPDGFRSLRVRWEQRLATGGDRHSIIHGHVLAKLALIAMQVDVSAARQFADAAVAIDPDGRDGWRIRMMATDAQRDVAESILSRRQLLEHQPWQTEVRNGLIARLHQTGHPGEAENWEATGRRMAKATDRSAWGLA